jgi:hypothetical protein
VKKSAETQLVRAVLEYLGLVGIPAFRVQNTGIWNEGRQRFIYHGTKGLPDIHGWIPGKPWPRPLFIETKSATGRLTPEQAAFLDNANRDGCLAFVVRDITELAAALRAEGVPLRF